MRLSLIFKIVLLGLGFLLLAAGGVAWFQRQPLLAWYRLHQLSQADNVDGETWVDGFLELDKAGEEALLNGLSQADQRICGNIGRVLTVMGRRLAGQDKRWSHMAARLVDGFPHYSAAGQVETLSIFQRWLHPEPSQPAVDDDIIGSAGLALTQAALVKSDGGAVHARALVIAETLLERACGADLVGDCRGLIQASLRDDNSANRLKAVQLAVHSDLGLLEQVMALLHDPDAEVRREVMLTARLAPETVVKTDDLLHWLHDPDQHVRRLCEAILTQRGMTREQIRLGRMLTHTSAAVRLEVLGALSESHDLEPGVWLRLLSVDKEPAVRVAAMRFASEHPQVDLSDRIDQMASGDPSPTVRDLAAKYLKLPLGRRLDR